MAGAGSAVCRHRSGSRCTGAGTIMNGVPTAWPAASRSTRMRHFAISVFTKPMPTPAGPVRACRAKRNGRALHGYIRNSCSSCLVAAGSGPPALIRLIRGTVLLLAQWANTTANLCAIRWYCAAAPAPHPKVTAVLLTAIFSTPTNAGSSPACVWPATLTNPDQSGTLTAINGR